MGISISERDAPKDNGDNSVAPFVGNGIEATVKLAHGDGFRIARPRHARGFAHLPVLGQHRQRVP